MHWAVPHCCAGRRCAPERCFPDPVSYTHLGNVDAGLLVVLVASCGNLDHGSGLTTADALGLAGNADGTAADADLDEVCAGLSQETEAFAVNHVTGANLHLVTVALTDPCLSLIHI